ncbi:MAG: ASKHA domain-containing protein, partial [Anaerolineae bacterium]
MTIHIDFEPVGRRGECPSGASLLDCARLLGIDLVNLCGGAGTCGRCVVQILEGEVSEPDRADAKFLTAGELDEGYRLACRTVPLTACKVRVPPESLTAPQRTQVEGAEVPIAAEPIVKAYPILVSPPSLEDLTGDADRLVRALGEQHGVEATSTDLVALQALSSELREGGWQAQAALRQGEVVALLPVEARPLGLAVDLGTTKVAGYLLDLESGQTLVSRGIMNPQIAFGEDIIARLSYASEAAAQACKMQGLVTEALSQLAAELCGEVGATPAQIVDAVVVGNTAMHHLLLRLSVEQLARAPYVPAVQAAIDVKARELGLGVAPGSYVHLLPNIAGYVGADHVAMILATNVAQSDGVVLALDIGTNTEVVLSNRGRLTSLSCASGPAFEGAHIKHGMRAARGAIEHVRLVDGQLEYQTIDGAPPVGLCGSGILDALAQLYEAGIVDMRGRMQEHPRVRVDGRKREFVLANTDGRGEVTFTQKDVRELQLAKGAMRTGIQV